MGRVPSGFMKSLSRRQPKICHWVRCGRTLGLGLNAWASRRWRRDRSPTMLDRTRSQPRTGSKRAAIPDSMLAAAIDRFGDLEVLTLHSLPVPSIDPGEVLVALD